MTRPFQIGDRVSRIGNSALGTVSSTPYEFAATLKVGVIWDAHPKCMISAAVSALVLAEGEEASVPPEARPYSVGALASPERRLA